MYPKPSEEKIHNKIELTDEGIKHDEIRTKYIHGLKLRIVRFENCEVFENPDRVLQEIRKYFR